MILALWILAGFAALYTALVLWLTFGRGSFRFVYSPFVARFMKMDGMTIGARCYARKPELIAEFPNGFEPLHLPADSPARRWWRHEKQHNRQWRVRPFMGPVYLVLSVVFGYTHNPLELEAEREENV